MNNTVPFDLKIPNGVENIVFLTGFVSVYKPDDTFAEYVEFLYRETLVRIIRYNRLNEGMLVNVGGVYGKMELMHMDNIGKYLIQEIGVEHV